MGLGAWDCGGWLALTSEVGKGERRAAEQEIERPESSEAPRRVHRDHPARPLI